MKEVGGAVSYFKYSECEEGQVLVDKMVYTGTTEGKYGRQNNFKQDGEKTVLNSAGQLNYKLDEFITVGDTVTVIFDGREELESGAFKGKQVNCFKVALHDEIGNVMKGSHPGEAIENHVAVATTETQPSLLDQLNE